MTAASAIEDRCDSVLIVGASGRAAAASARRSGLNPCVIDLFGDEDTRQLADVRVCGFEDYPARIAVLADDFPHVPYVYTGGIENHPRLIEELGRNRKCWGNSADSLALIRDPFWLQDVCEGAGIGFPRTARLRPNESGSWLRKLFASGGGRGIAYATDAPPSGDHYWQEFLVGEPMSAIFASDRSACELLGLSHQLIGQDWLHAEAFSYCGTVGPDLADVELEGELRRIGTYLHELSQLRGVWGIDFLRTKIGVAVLEVNPRYTASIEVLEHQLGIRSFDWIRWACTGGSRPASPSSNGKRIVGKAIYFAPYDLKFPTRGPWLDSLVTAREVERLGAFADIPLPNSHSPKGFPVLTFFAEADTRADCQIRLQSRAAELDRLFFGTAP